MVETAALVHDLGHPPFGHLAEEELASLVAETIVRDKHKIPPDRPLNTAQVEEVEKTEGYEGNAQSFRVITELAARRPNSTNGLDLTRASLNAVLKYPTGHVPGEKKFGVYASESAAFDFARRLEEPGSVTRCIEAQIMDWADDITYSVHDVEDFYRAGRIPLDSLRANSRERQAFRKWALARRKRKNQPYPVNDADFTDFLENFFYVTIDIERPFSGVRSQRQSLYNVTSSLIDKFVTGTKLLSPTMGREAGLKIDVEIRTQVELLKDMIWYYVIYNPALAAHQYGQRRAIRRLFRVLDEAIQTEKWYLFPPTYQEAAEKLITDHKGATPAPERSRLIADAISSLTDQQALRFFHRLTGSSQGSVLDPIVT